MMKLKSGKLYELQSDDYFHTTIGLSFFLKGAIFMYIGEERTQVRGYEKHMFLSLDGELFANFFKPEENKPFIEKKTQQ